MIRTSKPHSLNFQRKSSLRLYLETNKFKLFTVAKNDFLLCKIRQRLILAQPEELVRQALVGKLIESGVDEGLIDLEVPLARFKKRAHGRADVIVHTNDQRKNVALVIECKAKSVSLSNSALDQVARYNKVFK